MRTITVKSPGPVYAVAVPWVLWSLFFPMYTIVHFLILIALSVLFYNVAKRFFPDRRVEVEEEPEPLNPEIEALKLEGKRAIAEMRRLNEAISDETISAQIDDLERTTMKIFDHAVSNPSKTGQLRRFLSYYLPTTLKILNAYDRMGTAGIAGENIDGAMGKIENMMEVIIEAFHKQLDNLFRDEALDISADIDVMENLLAQEGVGAFRIRPE